MKCMWEDQMYPALDTGKLDDISSSNATLLILARQSGLDCPIITSKSGNRNL